MQAQCHIVNQSLLMVIYDPHLCTETHLSAKEAAQCQVARKRANMNRSELISIISFVLFNTLANILFQGSQASLCSYSPQQPLPKLPDGLCTSEQAMLVSSWFY